MSGSSGSIENLINPSQDEQSVTGAFSKKQKEIKIKEAERQTQRLAQNLGLNYINLIGFPISPEALGLISEEEARKLNIVCFFYDGRRLRFACLSPNQEILELVEKLSKKNFASSKLYLVSQNSLDYAIDLYKSVPKLRTYSPGVEIKPEQLLKFRDELKSFKNFAEKVNEVNVSDLITLILASALKVEASDVHIEAETKGIVIRFRLDGVLQEAAILDKEKWERVISRLKILSKVKINIENTPQDGRFSIILEKRKIDVRCSFLPTAFGESVVMRLLDTKAVALDIENLGMRPEMLAILRQEISKPNGLILTTGPTGSGKTTSLYAIINKLNVPGTKIITLEDPIEYQLPGINQSQINERRGFGFADGLRSVLRQDPNVLMVGEIRDLETAEISIQASLTGHLVLSTLHTNDATGVIPRLIDLGVKPYFLAPSINALIGQRLIRKLCPHCRATHKLSKKEEELIHKILSVVSPKSRLEIPKILPDLYQAGSGCDHCNFTGYKGRLGIFEIFTVSDAIRQLAIDEAPSFKILQQAIEDGMITMLQDGILKVIDGLSSLDELYRVVGDFDYVHELYDIVISQTIGRGLILNPDNTEKIEDLSKDISQADGQLKYLAPAQLIDLVMGLAIKLNTNDIHIEPTESDVKIRFRVDGILHTIASIEKTSYLPLLSEIKILAGTPTNIKKATFDGRFSVYLPDKSKIDCRVSIISGGFGETIVIRLLSVGAIKLDLDNLGFSNLALPKIKQALEKTKGIILSTGPTGSGKTTTLYSLLNKLNQSDVKIITVEDPIEYQVPGIIQTQIDESSGYTFASAMRSLLRQNPNIMMIGEIRDAETAKISIEAAMTGHLVLSTIHTNSAAGAISRFQGLGLSRQDLANSIEFSIGQRLVRRLCAHCKEEVKENDIKPEDLNKLKEILNSIKNPNFIMPEKISIYQARGCQACGNIGYKGRVGLFEVIEMSPELQKVIQKTDITDYEIEQIAMQEGTVSILQDGALKIINGETSLEELLRVA